MSWNSSASNWKPVFCRSRSKKPPITREQILFWFDHFRHGDPKDPAFQQQVIDCFVNAVYLFDDKIVLVFNYKEGDQLVTLEEVKSSILDDNAFTRKYLLDLSRYFSFARICRAVCNTSMPLFIFRKRT